MFYKEFEMKLKLIFEGVNKKVAGNVEIRETGIDPFSLVIFISHNNFRFSMNLPKYNIRKNSVDTIVNAIIDEYEAHVIDEYFVGGIAHPQK